MQLNSVVVCLVQLWDVNMEAAPVATFKVHEYLRPKVLIVTIGQKLSFDSLFWTIQELHCGMSTSCYC